MGASGGDIFLVIVSSWVCDEWMVWTGENESFPLQCSSGALGSQTYCCDADSLPLPPHVFV